MDKRESACTWYACLGKLGAHACATGIVCTTHTYTLTHTVHTYIQDTFAEAIKYNEGLKQHLGKVADDLNPLRAQVRR